LTKCVAVVGLLSGYLWSCQSSDRPAKVSQQETKTMHVEIIPKKAIGALQLGAKKADLPEGATFDDIAGHYQGIKFLLDGDKVEDVWIDDIRTFPHELLFRGKPVPKDASVDDLKALFAPCTEVEGILGGTFFNCREGIALGLDHEGKGKVVQIRLKPR